MSKPSPSKTNRLNTETSPYLLQHAHNPVDWWPWNPESLQQARSQNKPILLSIGYSACHWCHVMAHESFEDEATAAIMNQHFINIKVDREERPDLDKIYQTAHQLINQRGGGWPLTLILTPNDHTPFFAGTYFPPQPRYGMPAFKELLVRVADFYQQHQHEMAQQHQAFVDAFAKMTAVPDPRVDVSDAPLHQARAELAANFDPAHAGFGKAPKFPHPTSLERLLRHWASSDQQDTAALQMLNATLSAMADGGLFDQLGGGFFRYSVDDQWMIPHFEKMLYDNGPLLALYADAFAATGKPMYRRVVEDTADWVLREMLSPAGGFYSSLDADSEGHEGKFYVWTVDELQALLSAEEYRVFAPRFGLDRPANFEGHWHLHGYLSTTELSQRLGLAETTVETLVLSARQRCLSAREQRPRPGRDDKILTAWNALMIKGLAVAGRSLQRADYIDAAQRGVDFIRQQLFINGRLCATYKDGQAKLMAYLDDYAFMLDALLESLQASWRSEDLEFAIALAECLLSHFADTTHGGFYFTAHDHEQLLHRPKPMSDEATPAGNAIAAFALQRLGLLLSEPRYLNAVEPTLRCAWDNIQHYPQAHAALLHALEEYLQPPTLIILRGDAQALPAWQAHYGHGYHPRRLCFALNRDIGNLPAALHSKAATKAAVVAYICQGMQCHAPISQWEPLPV
ncbi:MAG: thioredoxin domain-containing protein [Gammaproteobacteria bacterium]|nr:thioredoxin domain-containing protein [Gammaproteobacteria bacterium]